jgi:FtsP/CotA-like multicopper oxidase with cupredoxin domain
MDGNGLGTLHGYHVDGQFGLPTLVVSLGDTIEITLQNDTFEAMGLHPHGVAYDQDNDGVSRVADPGGSVTYTWRATEGVGTFPYHSHQMDAAGYEYQAEAGVLGAIVVLDPAERPPDRMVTYLMTALYEPWTEAATGNPEPVDERDADGSNRVMAARTPPSDADEPLHLPGPRIEPGELDGHARSWAAAGHDTGGGATDTGGHAHGSGTGTLGTHNHALVVQTVGGEGWTATDTRESNVHAAKLGETVRMNVISFGSEFHTFHLHGHTWEDPGTGQVTDSVTVGPGTAYHLTLDPLDNPGRWNVHCHVESHSHSMSAWMDVD